jgi:hypothetical protein
VTDPTRWAEDEAAGEAHELLLAARGSKLPDAERRALWASIALSLPVAVPPPAMPPAALAARSSVGAYLTKGALFLATLGGLTFGAAQAWRSSAPPAVVQVPVAAKAPAAPSASAASLAPSTSVAPTSSGVPPAAAPLDVRPHLAAASQLREESLALLEARSALRSGDAARSLTLLEQARVRFPRGALGQEREALTIEALARSGQVAAAQRRAASFVRAHPNSPYVADVRRVAGP